MLKTATCEFTLVSAERARRKWEGGVVQFLPQPRGGSTCLSRQPTIAQHGFLSYYVILFSLYNVCVRIRV